jgi:hypothetical protein
MTKGAAREIVRRRLEAQRISAARFERPADVVAWLGAIQAQDYLGALWAVGLRLAGARESDVERALAERSIVRSWPMRGTLHFLAAADARWMIELLAPKAAAAAAGRLRALGIDDEVLSRARRALVASLEGGRHLTRAAAHRVLDGARIPTGKEGGLTILWKLAHEGLLCFGAREGKQQTFVLREEWLPRARRLPREEALAELAHRYFAGHGPATLRDFAWWSGMNLGDARRAIDIAGTALDEESIAGTVHWSVRASSSGRRRRAGVRAHVLPAFDEFFVGYADRGAAIDPVHAKRLGPFEVLGPVVLLDGRLVATWKRRLTRTKVICSARAIAPLAKASLADVRRALERYAGFLQLDLEMRAR